MGDQLIKVQGANTMNKNHISIKNGEEASCSLTDNCDDCRELFGCYQLIDSLVQDILLLEEKWCAGDRR